MSKEIEVKKKTEIAIGLNFEEDAGAGLEEADRSSFAIPFLSLLQALSPQVAEGTVEGAKPGLFINTITNELYKEALLIPCHFQRRFLRWGSKLAGGGFKGDYSPAEVETGLLEGIKKVDGKYLIGDEEKDERKDELKDTRLHFVLVQSESGDWQPALLSLSSTQIKKSKKLMMRIHELKKQRADGTSYTPASFSHIYKARSVQEKNVHGSWFGVEFDIVGEVQEAETYMKAKELYRVSSSGEIEVSHPEAEAKEESKGF